MVFASLILEITLKPCQGILCDWIVSECSSFLLLVFTSIETSIPIMFLSFDKYVSTPFLPTLRKVI